MIRLIRTDRDNGLKWGTEWEPTCQGDGWQADSCLVVYRQEPRPHLLRAGVGADWVPRHDAAITGSMVGGRKVPLAESDGGPSLLAYPDDRRDLGVFIGHLAFVTLLFSTELAAWVESVEPFAGAAGEVRHVDLPYFAGVDALGFPLIIIPAAIPGKRGPS